jgi:hypothetical protein
MVFRIAAEVIVDVVEQAPVMICSTVIGGAPAASRALLARSSSLRPRIVAVAATTPLL